MGNLLSFFKLVYNKRSEFLYTIFKGFFCKVVKPTPTLVLHVLCFDKTKKRKGKEIKIRKKEKKKERKKEKKEK